MPILPSTRLNVQSISSWMNKIFQHRHTRHATRRELGRHATASSRFRRRRKARKHQQYHPFGASKTLPFLFLANTKHLAWRRNKWKQHNVRFENQITILVKTTSARLKLTRRPLILLHHNHHHHHRRLYGSEVSVAVTVSPKPLIRTLPFQIPHPSNRRLKIRYLMRQPLNCHL